MDWLMKKIAHIESFIILLILLVLLPLSYVHAWPIPDTGQRKCHSDPDEVLCPAPGDAFYSQEGNNNINPLSYTKLDAGGLDSVKTWAMIRDNVKVPIGGNKTVDGSIHDKANTNKQAGRSSFVKEGVS